MPRLDTALLLLVIAAIFDAMAGPLYRLGPATVNFTLLAFAYLAWFWPTFSLLVLAGIVGVLLDLLSLDPPGFRCLILAPPILLIGRVQGWFITEHSLLRLLVLLPAFLVSALLQAFPWDLLARNQLALADIPWLAPLLTALYSTALALVAHALLDRFREPLGWRAEPATSPWR